MAVSVAEETLELLVREQAALRRVATLARHIALFSSGDASGLCALVRGDLLGDVARVLFDPAEQR